MEMQFSLEIENLSREAKEKLRINMKRILYLMGTKAVEGAVRSISGQYTPSNLAVDTGRLRASISFVTANGESGFGVPMVAESKYEDRLNGKAEENTVIVGSNVEYAQYVHDGTEKMAARPFLREGIDNTKDQMKQAIMNILKEAE